MKGVAFLPAIVWGTHIIKSRAFNLLRRRYAQIGASVDFSKQPSVWAVWQHEMSERIRLARTVTEATVFLAVAETALRKSAVLLATLFI